MPKNVEKKTRKLFLVGASCKRKVPVYHSDFTVYYSFFVRPQISVCTDLCMYRPCMYHFLVQTLIGLGRNQRSWVQVPALARNLFVHLRNRTRLKGPPFSFFSALGIFFISLSPKGPLSILLEYLLVMPGVKRYIRTFDVISELYCVLIRRRRRFENRSFPTHILKTALFEPRYSADFGRSRLVFLYII